MVVVMVVLMKVAVMMAIVMLVVATRPRVAAAGTVAIEEVLRPRAAARAVMTGSGPSDWWLHAPLGPSMMESQQRNQKKTPQHTYSSQAQHLRPA